MLLILLYLFPIIEFCTCQISIKFQFRDEMIPISNIYSTRCTYNRQCDEEYGYVCRNGKCSCKFGHPDPMDSHKCKIEVRLGDFCREIPRSSRRDRKGTAYIRRKCPYFSECSESKGICECEAMLERKGSTCIPRIFNAGNKSCRDHLDCMVQRGQQCYNRTCVECAVGRFKNFRPSAKWVTPNPVCTCFDLTSTEGYDQDNVLFRHKRKNVKGSTCIAPIALGDHCTISQNCIYPPWTPNLICGDGVCQCQPGSRPYTINPQTNPQTTICITPINSPCAEDMECHAPSAYCEKRLEVPLCKCREGFVLEGRGKNQYTCTSLYYEETCGKFLPHTEKQREILKDQRLSCIQGVYECSRPREMFWDKERGKCVSLVGGRCDLDLLDVTSCAGISRCWEYKSLGEFRCQCPEQDDEEEHKISRKMTGAQFEPSRDRKDCVRSDLNSVYSS